MKLLSYLRYGSYITDHWNLRLALFTIFYEIKGERKYGIETTGIEEIWQYDISTDDLSNAESYQPSSYYILEKLFHHLPSEARNGSIIDFGCGKGRALVVAMAFGFKKLIGIEIIHELSRDAEQNLLHNKVNKKDAEFSILNNRAQDMMIPDDSCVFLFFNPFKQQVMELVLQNILNSYKKSPRTIYVFYLNPVYKKLFLDNGFRELYHVQKLTYLEGSILVNA